uniref:ARAD1C45144p n=1 Tax=Blastobotrys adeninivorans TaxID=409370 RepID=A0A060T9J2_BLAAD
MFRSSFRGARSIAPKLRRLQSTYDEPQYTFWGSLGNPITKIFLTGTVTYFGLLLTWYQMDKSLMQSEMDQKISQLKSEIQTSAATQKESRDQAAIAEQADEPKKTTTTNKVTKWFWK